MTTAQAQAKPFDIKVGNQGEVYHAVHHCHTLFQFETVRQIVENPNFLHACGKWWFDAEPLKGLYDGPFGFIFHDKDGWLHFLRIGKIRILRHIATHILKAKAARRVKAPHSFEKLEGHGYSKNPHWKGKVQLTRDSKAGQISLKPFQD